MSTKTMAPVATCSVCHRGSLSTLEKANGGVHEYCRSLTGRSRAKSTTNVVVAS